MLAADADLDEDTLIDYARDHLARYKCPSKVLVVDELPRNAAGKLLRRSLDIAPHTAGGCLGQTAIDVDTGSTRHDACSSDIGGVDVPGL